MRKYTALLLCFLLFTELHCKKESASPQLNTSAVGASANDLLSAKNYPSLKIEIQYMPGLQPDASSVNNMTSFLKNIINKPNGISVTQTAINASGKSTLSLTEITAIESANRKAFTTGNEIAVYLLFIDAAYSDPNVLGISYKNTSICLMGKTIHDNSGGIGQSSRVKLESTVSEHEWGHLLGLVNIGSPMQTNHLDAAHGNHCNNSNCLMYYASETTDILGVLITGAAPSPDSNCLADLHANGGK